MTFEWFNAILLACVALIPITMLIVSRRPEWGASRAHRYSVRARLPFGSEEVAAAVRHHLRRLTRSNMWGSLAALALSGVVFLVSPMRDSPFFLWGVTVMLLMAVLAGSSAITSLRSRVFSPAAGAIRIARGQQLRTRDYLGPWRRLAPGALLAASALGVVALIAWPALRRGSEQWMLPLALCTLVFALLVFVATRTAERAVLARPQPASNTLELAWDDSFRADTLGWLRLSAAIAAWLPLGLAASIIWLLFLPAQPLDLAALAMHFPWWGIPILQLAYSLGEGQMRAALYPPSLSPRPTLTVGEALA